LEPALKLTPFRSRMGPREGGSTKTVIWTVIHKRFAKRGKERLEQL